MIVFYLATYLASNSVNALTIYYRLCYQA